MKKLIFGLIATVLFSISGSSQIKPSDYGFYHNEAIKLYNEKYLKGDINNLSKTNFEKMTNDMLELMKEKYPNEFKNVNTSQLKNHFDYSLSLDKYDFSLNWKKNKEDYIKKGYITQKISYLIDDITINGKDYNDIVKIITIFKSENTLTERETNSVLVFESVLLASNNLWTESNIFNKTKKNPCTPRVLISDAGVTVCTWYFGPLSAIAGAASSLITYYSDPDC